MRFLAATSRGLTFRFEGRERRLLLDILQLYPLIPASYHRLSKTADPARNAAGQQLLDEALATHKAENQRRWLAWFNEPGRFRAQAGGYVLTLTAEEADGFLQLLNDVRVGSWLMLGCPDPAREPAARSTADQLPYYVAMEYCGLVQSLVLRALDGAA